MQVLKLRIWVTLNKDGSCTVRDNGRGIPIEEHPQTKVSTLETVMTNLHSGAKFDQGAYKVSGGLHGIGMKCTNALSKTMETLGNFLEIYEKTLRLASKVMIYGMLDSSVDTTNQEAQARAGQGQSVYVRLNAATSFVNPELMSIGFDTLRKWMTEDERLAHLGHLIDELEREKEHVRSDEVEQVLAFSGEPLGDFYHTYNALTNADLQFDDAVSEDGTTLEVGQSSINSLITHIDRMVRQTGFEHYADGYINYKNTLASIQLGGIHKDVFNARTRDYPSSLEASLESNNIPPAVFHALIDTFQKNLPT